ncbi:hypothetical protein PHMEG_00028226 [Phytophthora megakarya]|uniref:Uncharacterized protein n=1 Tax=Phytophthora megakarya TaxID=4795 RepID=A0A225V5G7_9STRA|nr:hypothetical protein PHMEG_00028226 [Phytophthora megakarya]
MAVAESFLFVSEAIALAMDPNQAKISTVAGGDQSLRVLRSYKPVEDDSDKRDATEERGGNSALKDLAKTWCHSYSCIKLDVAQLTEKQHNAWKAIVNAGIDAGKKTKRDAYNKAWRRGTWHWKASVTKLQSRDGDALVRVQ